MTAREQAPDPDAMFEVPYSQLQQMTGNIQRLTAQLQAAQATIAEAKSEYEKALSHGWAPAAVNKMYRALSRAGTSALAAVKAATLDECLDAIEQNYPVTPEQLHTAIRASIEQTEAE